MHEFKTNDHVKFEADGDTVFGKILSVTPKHAQVLDSFEQVIQTPLSKLTYLPPIELDKSTYRAVIRLETDILPLIKGNIIENIVNSENYTITVEDFFAALYNLQNTFINDNSYSAWLQFLYMEITLSKSNRDWEIYTETDVMKEWVKELVPTYTIDTRASEVDSYIKEAAERVGQ